MELVEDLNRFVQAINHSEELKQHIENETIIELVVDQRELTLMVEQKKEK
jgi:hypothetical protein